MVTSNERAGKQANAELPQAMPHSPRKAGSEREAVAAQAKKPGIAISCGFNAGQKLMSGMPAALVVATRVVFVNLRHRHSGAGGFPQIQRRAIATKHFDR